jgi:hypothetical protein
MAGLKYLYRPKAEALALEAGTHPGFVLRVIFIIRFAEVSG